ncbi:hypothetical protein KP79_PYT16351 [Mizuhopecten yessoensis]|uniref:Uncharacterized protein n=1 Tax=Mizuhopecten yessoensis TaxID=6573 RepID=A0A210QWC3_MIZYE|nr:hypothetical protein KP79_PYT16351 [Mizuhopecten yessoensis]
MEKDKDFSEYPKEIKKARVEIKPWDNARRQAEPPTKLIESDQDTFESTTYDISITDLPADVLNDQEEEDNYDFPKMFVPIKKTEKPYEKSVLKHDQGSIKLQFRLRVIRNRVVYTLHIKKDGNWTKISLEKKVGSKTLEINLTDLSIASICLTSSRIYDNVSLDPEKETVYKNILSADEIITFPQGSVSTTTQVKVSTVSIDPKSKKKRLTDKSDIAALSNIAYIHTNENKLRHKAALTFKLDELFEMDDSPLETFVFHCDEKGLEIVDIPVQCVSESKALYQIEVDTFSGYGVGRRRTDYQRDVGPKIAHAMDMNYHRCKILLFIEKDDSDVSLWSEIVPAEEDIVEKTFQKREEEEKLIVLRVCRSPTVMVKNLENIRIEIPENVGIIISPSALRDPRVLSYDHESYENFHRLSISRNNSHQNEQAIVQYRRVQEQNDLLHQAHFGAHKYFTGTNLNKPRRPSLRTEHCAFKFSLNKTLC